MIVTGTLYTEFKLDASYKVALDRWKEYVQCDVRSAIGRTTQ